MVPIATARNVLEMAMIRLLRKRFGIGRQLRLAADLQHALAAVVNAPLPPRRRVVGRLVDRPQQLHALGEQLDEGRDLRLEEHRRRNGRRQAARLERRRRDPVDRREHDDA